MPSEARITTTVQTEALMALGRSPGAPLYRHMVQLEARVETKAKRNVSGAMVNVRTGNLRADINSSTEIRGNVLVGVVAADASYAAAVHEGTGPHDIVPKNGRVLAWQAPGGMRFATKVRHPGTKGRPFLRDALTAISTA